MDKVAEDPDDVNDVESDSDDSFIDDDPLSPEHEEDELHIEAPLTDAEVEELVAELLEVESKAAEAQESLEKESLAKVENEVREELAEKLHGDDLDMAVASEMGTFIEDWERTLDDLETDSAQLLEQLDGSGVDLPALYKWIESKIPSGCSTEAWKKRAHWVGSQISSEVTESIENAEKYLQSQRPVRKKQGRLVEEGASGFLGKKLVEGKAKNSLIEPEKDWSSFNEIIQSHRNSKDDNMFGGKHWASVYLASTPQQAADMGLKFPGVNEVEEIDDIDGSSSDPFIADAIANENEIDLSEEQRKNFRKVKEEEDANITRKFQLRLKRRRQRIRSTQECSPQEADTVDGILVSENDSIPLNEVSIPGVCLGASQNARDEVFSSNEIDQNRPVANGIHPVLGDSSATDLAKNRGEKRSCDTHERDFKRIRSDNLDSDDQMDVDGKTTSHMREETKLELEMYSEEEVDVAEPNVTTSSENFQCTICTKVVVASDVRQHPILRVIVCGNCKSVIDEKTQEKDPDCSLCYCGWCGKSDDLLSCKLCKILFCSACIKCNLGESSLSNCRTSGWHCFCCSPSLLERLTGECAKALAFTDLSVSSSDSDSEASGAGTNGRVRTRKRRKKKIRRIIDDAELGEETKQKIAIEKARQEHLQSLQEQFAGGSKTTISATFSGSTVEGVSAEALGDATKGYIVNVVREKEEEAVRIPGSISAKLKPHQIAGIRFMWENIIQCIRKVKSGDRGLGCILAHNMGLGKTFQVITFLYTAMRCVDLGLKSALIVTPVNVIHNWRHEFMKWKPVEQKALRIYMLDDVSREKRLDLLKKWKVKGGVFLIGYTSFRNLSLGKNVKDKQISQEICSLLQDGPDILVCDEAHMIKNTKADVTQALKQVKCQRRIALTGSPLQNNLMEYYCMVDFVREGFLGSSHEFRNRFQNPIENGQHANSTSNDVRVMNQRSHILYQQLKGFVQRMDMNVVKMDLPPKTVYVIAVKLSPLQRKLYRTFLDEHGFTKGQVSDEKKEVKRCFFAGYQALAQIWNHPAVLQLAKEQKDKQRREDSVENFLVDDISSDDNMEPQNEKQEAKNDLPLKKIDNNVFLHKDWWKNLLKEETYKEPDYGGKMVLLLEILTMSSAVGDKVLVFSQSLLTLDLIERYLSKLPRQGKPGKFWKEGKDWYRLDGSTAGSERQKLVEKFNESTNTRVKCTLISTKAGSLGINLHAANRVVIVDGSWNPTHDLQAIYRVWRYGQVKPVFAYRLMAHGTMEEKIYKRQVTKEGLAARVVDKQQVHRTMSKEEMLHLFEFGDDDNLDAASQEFEQLRAGGLFSQKLPLGTSSSDKVMESLLNSHHPRWIVNYHEHETLLQENEEEKLTKEEQDIVWENYQKGQWEEVTKVVTPQAEETGKVVTSNVIQWEEVHRVYDDSDEVQIISKEEAMSGVVSEKPRHIVLGLVAAGAPLLKVASRSTNPPPSSFKNDKNSVQRKCTNLSHLLTLRSQGTKAGCTTVCGECAQVISWEMLSRNVKPPGKTL